MSYIDRMRLPLGYSLPQQSEAGVVEQQGEVRLKFGVVHRFPPPKDPDVQPTIAATATMAHSRTTSPSQATATPCVHPSSFSPVALFVGREGNATC